MHRLAIARSSTNRRHNSTALFANEYCHFHVADRLFPPTLDLDRWPSVVPSTDRSLFLGPSHPATESYSATDIFWIADAPKPNAYGNRHWPRKTARRKPRIKPYGAKCDWAKYPLGSTTSLTWRGLRRPIAPIPSRHRLLTKKRLDIVIAIQRKIDRPHFLRCLELLRPYFGISLSGATSTIRDRCRATKIALLRHLLITD